LERRALLVDLGGCPGVENVRRRERRGLGRLDAFSWEGSGLWCGGGTWEMPVRRSIELLSQTHSKPSGTMSLLRRPCSGRCRPSTAEGERVAGLWRRRRKTAAGLWRRHSCWWAADGCREQQKEVSDEVVTPLGRTPRRAGRGSAPALGNGGDAGTEEGRHCSVATGVRTAVLPGARREE